MADINRQRFGGLEGYSIYRVEKTNEEGVVTSAAFEVLTPEGEFLDRFKSLEQAMRLVKSLAGVPADDDDFY
ncbi:hypothetical protein M3P05_19345 [Sansalvadorimonas sp. 2012CJ34-2]|uniref:Uncharacterized protein n=1 Tax=Parendozoicomonas callyspongiae TaxID=2942213 RepID=A0ABT0PM79_9GAMM|nr:hypothetical protein [Sansalvadorimonas sp. 2012CJ34-2]MCL6272081.1 hypothetical protein [Sansalvadorimonas sp. 2012CJ34-2]